MEAREALSRSCADFLVLSADPLEDIRNTRKLVSIWHGGREIKPRVAIVASK